MRNSSALVLILVLFSQVLEPVLATKKTGNFNFNGTTGLLNIPIAQVLQSGEYKAVFHGLGSQEKTGELLPIGDQDLILTGGIGQNCEVGLTFLTPTPDICLNFQCQLLKAGKGKPAIALGAQNLNEGYYITDKTSSYPVAERSFYLVLSLGTSSSQEQKKTTELDLKTHLGAGNGRFRGLFGGLELRIAEKTSFIVEYDGIMTNLGLRSWAKVKEEWNGDSGDQKKAKVEWVLALLDLREFAFGLGYTW